MRERDSASVMGENSEDWVLLEGTGLGSPQRYRYQVEKMAVDPVSAL